MKKVIALLCLLPLAACVSAPMYPTAYAYKPITQKHSGCVNHDLHDFHGGNAQQDC